ncbi:MAG: response regulator transcription factor [Oligoflexia bacterium]|nr:response regulator transcription factor [Oligoflexia bacterium]
MNHKIVLIEDDKDITEIITIHLQQMGYQVFSFVCGEMAIEYLKTEVQPPDLFILDILLPGLSGIEICKTIKGNRLFGLDVKQIPILMLTALAAPDDIVAGLDAGADDYLTKPFDNNVLTARIRALLRRGPTKGNKSLSGTTATSSAVLFFHQIKMDIEQYRVWLVDDELQMTLTEFRMLCELIKAQGKVLTREQLIKNVSGDDVFVGPRTIDTHMVALRKKLGDHSTFIESVRGVGYRII